LVQTIIFTFGIPISHKVQGRPFASGRDVFGTLDNFSDWGLGVAIPYSWFAFMWVNSAWMCPVYVAEETQNAPVEIPKSIVSTYLATTVAGLVVCLISAFCITDISAYAHEYESTRDFEETGQSRLTSF
jgi:amino acid transporter